MPEPWLPGPFDDGRTADVRWIVSVDAGSHRSCLGRVREDGNDHVKWPHCDHSAPKWGQIRVSYPTESPSHTKPQVWGPIPPGRGPLPLLHAAAAIRVRSSALFQFPALPAAGGREAILALPSRIARAAKGSQRGVDIGTDAGRMKSWWWYYANRRIVNDALRAWQGFDRGVRPTTYASEHWHDYIKARRVTGKGYFGGDWKHVWLAHQQSLRQGAAQARAYSGTESRAEQVVIYSVLTNVETYCRGGRDLDSYLHVAIAIGSYPRAYPTDLQKACSMTLLGGWHTARDLPWYPELLAIAGKDARLLWC